MPANVLFLGGFQMEHFNSERDDCAWHRSVSRGLTLLQRRADCWRSADDTKQVARTDFGLYSMPQFAGRAGLRTE